MEFVESLEDTLHVRTVHLHHQAPPNAPFHHTKAVNVKLSGDGTKDCMWLILHSHDSNQYTQVRRTTHFPTKN